MPPVGFDPLISAGERPQTHALDRVDWGSAPATYTKKLTSMETDKECNTSGVFDLFWSLDFKFVKIFHKLQQFIRVLQQIYNLYLSKSLK